MNDPEVTMPDANTNLIAHSKALEAAGAAIKLVMRVPAALKPIADQTVIRERIPEGGRMAGGRPEADDSSRNPSRCYDMSHGRPNPDHRR